MTGESHSQHYSRERRGMKEMVEISAVEFLVLVVGIPIFFFFIGVIAGWYESRSKFGVKGVVK